MLSTQEVNDAQKMWSRKHGYYDYESNLDTVMKTSFPSRGHLRSVRKFKLLTASQVSKKLRISRSAYSRLEYSEENLTITLHSLCKAADALDCELVYFLRPKSKKLFSKSIWEKVLPEVRQHPWLKACNPKRKSFALVWLMERLLKNTDFRRKNHMAMY